MLFAACCVWIVDRCVMYVVCRMLSAACWMLVYVRVLLRGVCLLRVDCCLWLAVRCVLFVVCVLFSVVVCWLMCDV